MKLLLLLFLTFSMNDTQAKKEETKTIVVGGGCFWCTEAIFKNINGVVSIFPGYMGGHVKNPSYKKVCEGNTGHAEVIKIEYDSSIISFKKLLE